MISVKADERGDLTPHRLTTCEEMKRFGERRAIRTLRLQTVDIMRVSHLTALCARYNRLDQNPRRPWPLWL